jgi:light-regulated signal transduction histidine kinase (bacteriophytochrome)
MFAIEADEATVTDAVQRLLENSIKFGRPGTPVEVTIRAERTGAEVVIAIEDNGIGVEEPYWEKCFGMFKRLHSQSEFPGEGVGLAFARKAVEKNGGRIWMEANEGPGITVKIALPAWTESED